MILVLLTVTVASFGYFHTLKKEPNNIQNPDIESAIKEEVKKDDEKVTEVDTSINEEEKNENDNRESEIGNNSKHEDDKPNVVPTPSAIPKPSPTPPPSQKPNDNSSINNNQSTQPDKPTQEEEKPKVEISKEKTDLEYAIQYQLENGDPVTYGSNGKMLTVDECMQLGQSLLNKQETSFVYQYECPFTEYDSATAVGLVVYFKYNGLQRSSSYDEYKLIIQ